MTTPDHHPYLAACDLRTAEDVLEWLWDRVRAPASEGFAHRMVATSASALEARLDRERRQACRRGALVAFATAARMMRTYEHDLSLGAVNDWLEGAITAALADALAFRAAARTP